MKNDELDDLKSAWNTAGGEQKPLGREELLPLIRRRAQSVFSGMRRNLLAESVLGALAMIAWGWFVGRIAPGNGEAYLAALQMTLLTVLPLSVFYIAGFRRLGRGIDSDTRLVPALQQTIAHWDQILPLYFWGGAAIMPSFILSGVWFVNSLSGQYMFKITEHMTWVSILMWVIGLSAFSLLFVWISIKVSYAKHVKQLKACLRELEEAE